MMSINNEIRDLLLKESSSGLIRDAARRGGMRLLNEDGIRLINEGVTTLDEILRVTKDECMD